MPAHPKDTAKRKSRFRNQLEIDYPNLREDAAKFAEVEKALRRFIGRLREIVGVRPDERQGTCPTCAFNPATDADPRFADTVYGLLWVLLRRNKFFLCHGNQEDWGKGEVDLDQFTLCVGFVRSIEGPNLREAVYAAEECQGEILRAAGHPTIPETS